MSAVLRLFLESFFELCICQSIAMIGFYESEDMSMFLDSSDNVFCTVMTSLTSVLVLIFPGVVYFILKVKYDHLGERSVEHKFGSLYESVDISRRFTAHYTTLFMLRRMMTVYILISLINLPFFVCQTLMIFSTANLIYLIGYKPLQEELGVEIFNEGCILLVSHVVNVLLNDALPLETKEQLGWVLIGISGFNILVNILLTTRGMFSSLFTEAKQKWAAHNLTRAIDKKITTRKLLVSQAPDIFPNFEAQLTIYEVIQFCKIYKS